MRSSQIDDWLRMCYCEPALRESSNALNVCVYVSRRIADKYFYSLTELPRVNCTSICRLHGFTPAIFQSNLGAFAWIFYCQPNFYHIHRSKNMSSQANAQDPISDTQRLDEILKWVTHLPSHKLAIVHQLCQVFYMEGQQNSGGIQTLPPNQNGLATVDDGKFL